MRKRRRRKTKHKKSYKPFIWLAFVIITGFFVFFFQDELKISYLKVRSFYKVYKRKYASKNENEKILKIIKLHKNHIFGLDISQYQGIINWNKINFLEDSIPVSFVIIRATAGKNKTDNYFTYNWREAKSKNITRGAYHYYRPNENSEKQAQNFINKVKLKKGDLVPILDIEDISTIQSINSLREGIQNWLNIIEKEYNVKPIIYTGDSFYKDNLKNKGFEDYPIWIANYNKNIIQPKIKDWIIWQFSDKGRATGISEFVDLNVFDGNKKMLELLVIKE